MSELAGVADELRTLRDLAHKPGEEEFLISCLDTLADTLERLAASLGEGTPNAHQGAALARLMARHGANHAHVAMGGQGLSESYMHVFLAPHTNEGFASIANGGCGIDAEGHVSS